MYNPYGKQFTIPITFKISMPFGSAIPLLIIHLEEIAPHASK